MKRFVTLLGVASLCLLAACSSRSPYGGTSKPTGVKLGKPYTIDGQLYVPKYDPNYAEVGVASWYGPGFNGRMTASGERYDMNDLTAAHRTLPMPALVRVTSLDTGRSIIVRVNDRGPFKKDRLIDMSSGAADALGMKPVGTLKVRVEYLPEATEKYLADIGLQKPDWMVASATPHTLEEQYADIAAQTGVGINPAKGFAAPPPVAPSPLSPFSASTASANVDMHTAQNAPTASVSVSNVSSSPFSDQGPAIASPPPAGTPVSTGNIPSFANTNPAPNPAPAVTDSSGHYFVQTASFGSEQNAKTQVGRVSAIGPAQIRPTVVSGRPFYRVMIGPVKDSAQAQQILERAKGMGFTDARILVQ